MGPQCRPVHGRQLALTFIIFAFSIYLPEGHCQLQGEKPTREERRFQAAVKKQRTLLNESFQAGEHRQGSCACYLVEHTLCCYTQHLCVCENVCYNGKQMVSPGGPLQCKDGADHVQGGPLSPIDCATDRRTWEAGVRLVSDHNVHGNFEPMDEDWLGSREAVEWWPGTTYLHALGRDTTNIAHFIGKVMQVLMVNNATLDAFTMRVDRFAFPRHAQTLARMRQQGSWGFHSILLAALLRVVLQPLYGPNLSWAASLKSHMILGDLPMGAGEVHFEMHFNRAADERPLCFEKVIMPTVLRAVSYIGGQRVANKLQRELLHGLNLEPNIATERVRLMWIVRDPAKTRGRRSFTEESRAALHSLCEGLNLEIVTVDFDGMSFKDQFREVQEADIMLAIHGAGLVNPTTFGRHKSVVLEIMPFHIAHKMYKEKAVATGITYMLHQCRLGKPQALDELYSSSALDKCEQNAECKHWYMHERHVELTSKDLADIETLLRTAKQFVLDARASAKTAGTNLRSTFQEICMNDTKAQPGCRQTLIRSPLVDVNFECVLGIEC